MPNLESTISSPTPVEPADSSENQAAFTRTLLAWFYQSKRDLPWRRTHDPYAIWISETMLQQTQVATVVPYWTRWLERFPTVRDLAEAPLDDVLKHWQGLGYYARARNLHRAAQQIMERHEGVFPARFEDILALPGVGRYTAGAVGSIALGLPVPIVDANVIRVLCRAFGIEGDPKSTQAQERLWNLAEALLPSGKSGAFNEAMMELGALICHAKPRCGVCPVQSLCVAFQTNRQDKLPEFAPKGEFTRQTDVSAIVTHPTDANRFLLTQRPKDGLWGGLWEFPRATCAGDETPENAAIRAVRETTGLRVCATGTVLGSVRHGVTTRKITLLAHECGLSTDAPLAPPTGWAALWVARSDIESYALPSPQARLVEQLHARELQPSLF